MTSISGTYLAYGSKGLTETGKQEGLKRLGYATGGVALTVMGVALAVITVLFFIGVIPGLPPLGPDRVFNIVMGTMIGIVPSFVPIACLIIPGSILAANSTSRLGEELSAEERATLLEAPLVKDFEPYKVL